MIRLSKLSYLLRFRPDGYGFDLQQADLVDERLSEIEIELLWERFASLDEKLRTDENFDVEEFVATRAV